MALFTDGNISSTEDLAAHDSNVLTVANTEGIDLSQKARLALDELAVELTTLVPRTDVGDPLESVVVTAPLRLWHAFHTLELVYRDAYNSQLNDRYKGRWEEYRKLSGWAAARLLETGVGMVAEPVPQAGKPRLSIATGEGSTDTRTYYARAALVNARGEEGAAGDWAIQTVPGGCSLVAQAPAAMRSGLQWNVYVGWGAEETIRQNSSPLATTEIWLETGPLTTEGPRPGPGQSPTYLRALPRMLQRG